MRGPYDMIKKLQSLKKMAGNFLAISPFVDFSRRALLRGVFNWKNQTELSSIMEFRAL